MGYRVWVRAGTALVLAIAPGFEAFAQSGAQTNPRPAAPATISVGPNSAPTLTPTIVPILNPAAQDALQRAISSNQRIEPSRDRWRNPTATLQFFGVRPTDTVVEVWPGQGWYTSILGPYLKQGGGSLVVGHFDAASTNSSIVRQIVDAYRARFASDNGTYGSVNVVPFGPRSGALGLPGTADSVLTFRNIHNWMAQGWAEKAFSDFFVVLKPGGILGIEEHRGRTDEPQDPLARDGYVREDFVIQLAREAGFDFIGRSEINANPADTKDHPFGVWTLPPVSRTSPLGQRDDPGFDRTRYSAIGESDRMTLRFRKPLSATGAPPAPGTRWTPVIVAPAPRTPTPTPTPAPQIARVPVARPTVAAPAVATPAVQPPRPATSPTVATPVFPVQITAPATRPPAGPSVAIVTPTNSEAAPPRPIEPAPTAVSPPPISPPPIVRPVDPIVMPATPSGEPPIVEARPLEPIVAPAPAPTAVTPTVPPVVQLPPATLTNPAIPETPAPTPAQMPAQIPAEAPGPAPAPVPIATPPVAALPAPQATPRPAAPRPAAPRPPAVRPAAPPPPATTPQPAAPRPIARPPAKRPDVVRPPVSAVARPSAAPKAKATPARPTPARPTPARPALTRPAAAPPPKAKAKTTPPAARPAPRPAPIPKKQAPTRPVDPNKPDWIVPRQRS